MEINEINKINPMPVDIENYNQQQQVITEKEHAQQAKPSLRTSKAAMRKAKAENPNPILNSTNSINTSFVLQKDTAQYKGSDYANAVRVERGISLEEAFKIAENGPEIDYFVYVKGQTMVLEIPSDVQFDSSKDPLNLVSDTDFIFDSGKLGSGNCRIFNHGDVVFFKKEGMWLGTAPGLADTYLKKTAVSK